MVKPYNQSEVVLLSNASKYRPKSEEQDKEISQECLVKYLKIKSTHRTLLSRYIELA